MAGMFCFVLEQLMYFLLSASVVVTVYFSWFCTSRFNGQLVYPSSINSVPSFTAEIFAHISAHAFPSKHAFSLYFSWFTFQLVLDAICPGETIKGQPLKNNKRLKYTINGFNALKMTFFAVVFLHSFDLFDFGSLVHSFGSLISASLVVSTSLSAYLFVFCAGKRSKSTFKSFWLGKRLNPRFGDFDLKFFLEGRPGLLLWLVFDFAFCVEYYEKVKDLSKMVGLLVVCAMHFIYVADYFINESAILSTMDITTENLGFMLCFGDMVWVPFVYSLHSSAFFHRPENAEDNFPLVFIGVLLFVSGSVLFRKANSQKHNFRKDQFNPIYGKNYIETKRGTRLFTGGLWGKARHMNYTGDILIAWGMSLSTGNVCFWNFFYPLFFTGLIVHREWRDDKKCFEKYSTDWERYRRLTPYRLVPYLY